MSGSRPSAKALITATNAPAQSDDSNSVKGWGLLHQVLAGVDLAQETFHGFALATPAGVTLNKTRCLATVATPDR